MNALSEALAVYNFDNNDADTINIFVAAMHHRSCVAGWYTDPKTGEQYSPNDKHFVGSKMALIHSEISEAVEGHRKGTMDDHLLARPSTEVELADAVIRIFDLAGFLHLDLGGAIVEKLAYNAQRADHKVENRVKDGGKAY